MTRIIPMSRATSVPGRCWIWMRSVTAEIDIFWIGNDEIGTVARCFLHLQGENRMRLGGVGAYGQDGGGTAYFIDRVGHCAASQRGGQTGHGRGVSETGAVINVVRPHHRTGKFLDQVVVFIGYTR